MIKLDGVYRIFCDGCDVEFPMRYGHMGQAIDAVSNSQWLSVCHRI